MADISLIIGGPQGGGIESAGQMALKAFVLKGYNVLGNREYQSNIMGAHSYYHLRVGEERPRSVKLPVDVVIALDAESVFTHMNDVRPGGFLIYDSGATGQRASSLQPMAPPLKARVLDQLTKGGYEETVSGAVKLAEDRGARCVGLPMKNLIRKVAEETGRPPASVAKTLNTIGLAAGLSLVGVELEVVLRSIEVQFAGKPKVVAPNTIAAKLAYSYVSEVYGLPDPLPHGPHRGRVRMLASGNELVAMAKLIAGVGFLSYYPITPSSDEAFYLEEHRYFEYNGSMREETGVERGSIVVLQPEDELAAINSAIGAAYAGARSSTTTSGPGFSLMNEAISLAVEAEAPLVITLWMRAGPSTGMPTRVGQQDLLHALFSGHGDSPKIVLASGDHVEAFHDTLKAFNWAERFQTPVIHLLDKYLASSMVSVDEWEVDPRGFPVDRGKWAEPGEGYIRYELTEDGISPRAPLGSRVMFITGLEHTPDGMPTEDPVAREEMMLKRMRKAEAMEEGIPEEERAVLHGDPDAEIAIISWGSTKQPIIGAIRLLGEEGLRAKFLQIRTFSPFPRDSVARAIESSDVAVGVEMNSTGQAAFLVKAFTGLDLQGLVLKLNGRPMFEDEIAYGVRRVVEGGERRVIVSGGA